MRAFEFTTPTYVDGKLSTMGFSIDGRHAGFVLLDRSTGLIEYAFLASPVDSGPRAWNAIS